MRLFIVLIFLFTSTTAFSQPKKGLFEGVGAFLGNLGYDLVGSLLDFASATLNFLADPKQGIKDIEIKTRNRDSGIQDKESQPGFQHKEARTRNEKPRL